MQAKEDERFGLNGFDENERSLYVQDSMATSCQTGRALARAMWAKYGQQLNGGWGIQDSRFLSNLWRGVLRSNHRLDNTSHGICKMEEWFDLLYIFK
ncbi:unnamed protein product [Linum trigynum]|uniref:Uncharacterized protein n=1 Tax=Linum trigynum TaxID=586398 RepID=A0AAV2CK99_9ROSI